MKKMISIIFAYVYDFLFESQWAFFRFENKKKNKKRIKNGKNLIEKKWKKMNSIIFSIFYDFFWVSMSFFWIWRSKNKNKKWEKMKKKEKKNLLTQLFFVSFYS